MSKKLTLEHKRNLMLINMFPDNWMALLTAITSNKGAGSALTLMGIREYKTPNHKLPVKQPKYDWETVDKQVETLISEGMNIRDIGKKLGIPENTIWSRFRKLGKKVRK